MLLRHLLENNRQPLTNRFTSLSSIFKYFVTGQKLLSLTKSMINIDTVEFDTLCEVTLSSYRKGEKKDKHKEKNQGGVVEVKEQKKQYTLEDNIKYLYEKSSQAKIGFLKGDIHAEYVFKLNKYLSQKNPHQLRRDLKPQEFKKLLNQITDPRYFRLPKKGIKKSALEDKVNMHKRQIMLEIVSNERSHQKYDNILESLEKLGKIHLTSTFRRYLVDWFQPLCQAIQEEQERCKDESQHIGKRKIYAQAFLTLEPQRLSLICLSELLKNVTAILYKDFVREEHYEEPGFQQQEKENQFYEYDQIRYRPMCIAFARWVSVQSHFDEKEQHFKMVMKLYDSIKQSHKEEKADLIKKRQQQRLKERLTSEDPNDTQSPENIDQESAKDMSQTEIDQKIHKKQYADRLNQIYKTYSQRYIPPQERKQYIMQIGNKLVKQHYKYKSDMSQEVQYEIGDLLIFLMQQILKIKNKSGFKVPLFTTERKLLRKKNQVISDKRLKINQYFLDEILPQIEKEGDLFLHLDRAIPTIIPSMPWVQYEIGGYYHHPSCVMRFSECKVQQRLVKYSDLSRVFGVLNYLGKIPWKINKKVFEVVQKIWQQGGMVGEIPKRYSQMITTYLTKLKLEKNYKQVKELNKIIQKLRDEHSLRSDFNLKLNLTRAYSKLDRFYYPHNLDFRGRVYPIPPHFNHIGNDLTRGLLMFADGRKLGKNGLKWLKIHCANLMGKDKATLDEKLQFAEANLGLIHAIAQKPLKNRQWLQFQDCWQALGAIIELSTALKQKNPQEYVSSITIHQDGSCNGLQHYAALGRDTEGAFQVNLGATQRPGDVYTHVAKMVIKMIDEAIANPQHEHHELAKKLSGNIKRKTIKQTVMTSVYGVTFIGARQQIYRQLKDQKFLKNDDEEYAGSIYVAKLTLQAISNLFSSAHHIKKWLITCAKIISETENPVGWITPMGLPVVQPYRKSTQIDKINTIVHNLQLTKRSQNMPVNKLKQKSAFPPNFVHSLDSTHMMYTAERCMKLGLTFAAVHDSYWTHAGTVEKMNQILREEFIRLHSEPLLQNLKKSFEMRYPDLQFPNIPRRGDFNLQEIKKSLYFFS